MKIRIISSIDDFENLNPDEKMVHLKFRPSNVDLISLTQRCPGLRFVRMSFTHYKALSTAIRAFMNLKGIELLAGNIRDYKKDQTSYLTVDDAIEKKILALAKKGIPVEEISDQIKEEFGLDSDLIRYVMAKK